MSKTTQVPTRSTFLQPPLILASHVAASRSALFLFVGVPISKWQTGAAISQLRQRKSRMGWSGVEMIRVPANGIRFEVATMGGGDRLALCLHGFPEHAVSWRHQMPLLAKLGYRVWAPNLRGYGATDSPQDVSAYRPSTLIEDVAALIKAAGANETLLIAHDWGGALAWMLAMRRPELVNRLVIMNVPHPACFARELRRPRQLLKSWYMFFFQIPALPEFLLGRNDAQAIGDMFRLGGRHRRQIPERVIDVYRQNAIRPGGLTAMLNWYRAFFQSRKSPKARDARPDKVRFPKINTPTLFLWGNADVALDFRTTQGTQNYVSDLTFRVLPGISHWVQQEAPEAVNAMLEAWLTGSHVPEDYEIIAASTQ
jgi:epoxide hydrolase 4